MTDLVLPLVIGHRGAAGHAPENTPEAIRAAASLGCAWVEVDVRPAACGTPVLHHDARTPADATPVEATPLDALTARGVPTLDEVLQLVAALGLGINLEIKPGAGRTAAVAPAVVAACHENLATPSSTVLISSYDHGELEEARRLAPKITRGLLFERLEAGWSAALDVRDARVIGLDDRFLDEGHIAEVLHRRPDVSLVVFTVNDAERAARLHAAGVTSVFTDYPDRLLDRAQAG